MDIVYIYRRFGDEREIRYSLRSACANLKFDTVHIVGDRPRFVDGVNHIAFRGPNRKHENAFSKLHEAVKSSEVSDCFVLMNDDFFILKPMRRVPYLYMGTLAEWVKTFPHNSSYKQKGIKTLSLVGDQAKIFETHSPIAYEKDKLRFLIKKHELPCGIMLRSLYCHTFKIKGEYSPDYKARNPQELDEFSQKPFMSTTNEMARTGKFLKLMQARFPEPCQFERVH